MSIKFSKKSNLLSKNTEVFSDFYVNLDAHPDNNQIVKNINEKSVIRSIKNLILTDQYERPFQPEIGSNIKKSLFEPISQITTESLKNAIKETITTYEPRAGLLDVIVMPVEERNLYVITISFFLNNLQETTSFTVQLSRVR